MAQRLFILMPCHMCARQRGKVMYDTLAEQFNRSFPTRKMFSHFVRDSNYFAFQDDLLWLISDFRESGRVREETESWVSINFCRLYRVIESSNLEL